MEPVLITKLATGKQSVQTSKGASIRYTLADDRYVFSLDPSCNLCKCEVKELGEFLIKMSELMDG